MKQLINTNFIRTLIFCGSIHEKMVNTYNNIIKIYLLVNIILFTFYIQLLLLELNHAYLKNNEWIWLIY